MSVHHIYVTSSLNNHIDSPADINSIISVISVVSEIDI